MLFLFYHKYCKIYNDLKKKTGKYSRSYSYFPPNSERICKIQEIHSVDSHILMLFYAFAGNAFFYANAMNSSQNVCTAVFLMVFRKQKGHI